MDNKKVFLSYCVTCMNRIEQLKKTLPYNMDRLKDDEQLCLVNFNSKDGLDEWISENFIEYIKNEKLIYFYTKEPKYFDMSKAKNLSHRLSNSEWVFNLDGDNYITQKTRICIENASKEFDNFFIWERGIPLDGSGGRICVKRKEFFNIGGYDEIYDFVSQHDYDLQKLLCLNKKICIRQTCDKRPIKNSKTETAANTRSKVYSDYSSANKKKFESKIRNNIIKNNELGYKIYRGILNFEHDMFL